MGVVQTLTHPQSPVHMLGSCSRFPFLQGWVKSMEAPGVVSMQDLHQGIGQWGRREADHMCVCTRVSVD